MKRPQQCPEMLLLSTKESYQAMGLRSSWLSLPAQSRECPASLVSRDRDKGLTPETIWIPRFSESWPSSKLLAHGLQAWRPPTCPSSAADSGWPPLATWTYPSALQPPHTPYSRGPTALPLEPQKLQPPPPTHWAGPRLPEPFKLGPYHHTGRGLPGRAGQGPERA